MTYKEAAILRGQKKKVVRLERNLAEAKAKLEGYVFIDKKPDYFYSFSGFLIFRRWYIMNGLTAAQAEVLIIMSYVDVFLTTHFKLYTRNHTRVPVKDVLAILIEQKYVIKIQVQGKNKLCLRKGWVLTQRGKDFEADYERFYDAKIADIKIGKIFSFNLEEGMYFRKVYLTPRERRLFQGGGKLPQATYTGGFVEQEDLNRRYEET